MNVINEGPRSIARAVCVDMCVQTSMNVNQQLLIVVIRFESPAGFPSSDLIRDYFIPRVIR